MVTSLLCADAVPIYNYGGYFGRSRRINIQQCYGNESQLLSCEYTTSYSSWGYSRYGVHCQGETVAGMH